MTGITPYTDLQIQDNTIKWVQRYDSLSSVAESLFDDGLNARGQDDVTKAISYFSIAWGFYHSFENISGMYRCKRHLLSLIIHGENIKDVLEEGYGKAKYCIGLDDMVNEVLGEDGTFLVMPQPIFREPEKPG